MQRYKFNFSGNDLQVYLCSMKILLVAATDPELGNVTDINRKGLLVSGLISGMGMVATAARLTRELCSNRFDLILNIGIAGAFNRNLEIGSVIRVREDILSELGAEDNEDFLNLQQMNLQGQWEYSENCGMYEVFGTLRPVRSVTVNTVHGNEKSIQTLINRLQPDTESMEGAACFHVARDFNIPVAQIRAVSNYVTRRNKDAWNVPLALKNLQDTTRSLLDTIQIGLR